MHLVAIMVMMPAYVALVITKKMSTLPTAPLPTDRHLTLLMNLILATLAPVKMMLPTGYVNARILVPVQLVRSLIMQRYCAALVTAIAISVLECMKPPNARIPAPARQQSGLAGEEETEVKIAPLQALPTNVA